MHLPRTIAGSIQSIAKAAIGKDWALYATLLNHWPEIVGQDYAKITTPVKITFPQGKKVGEKWAQGHRTGGVLTIKIPQGLAMEFSFTTETMLARINSYFGYGAIGKIALEPFYQTPPTSAPFGEADREAEKSVPEKEVPKAYQDSINDIENNELADALRSLGRHIQQDNE